MGEGGGAGGSLPIFTVDVFTKQPFSGNPAAVCLVSGAEDIPDDVKQKIATEMKVSATAFVTRIRQQDDFEQASRFGIRWFTPAVELPLCGHASIATAAVLFNINKNNVTELHLETRQSGTVVARQQGDKIALNFPSNPPEKLPDDSFDELIKISTDGLPYDEVFFNAATRNLFIRLSDSVTRLQFESASPPVQLMEKTHREGRLNGVLLTLKAHDEQVYDFLSRYFCPWLGLDEDPVTGSAHTTLGTYWSKQLNKKQLFGRQCSKRGGEIWMAIQDNERIEVAGNAVTLIEGRLRLDGLIN